MDNFGTVNLVEACRKTGVNRFILVSSILVNGAAMGQILNPAYIILNVFGLTLIAKLQAEQYIRRSGINYTIIRPGGLRDEPATGSIIMEPEVKIPIWAIKHNLLYQLNTRDPSLFRFPVSFILDLNMICRILCMKVPYLETRLQKLLWDHSSAPMLSTKLWRLFLDLKLRNAQLVIYLLLLGKVDEFFNFLYTNMV